MEYSVRCPFCGTPYESTPNFVRGSYKLRCGKCRRTFLLVVKVYLKIFRNLQTRML